MTTLSATDYIIIFSELGLIGASVALPIIIPLSIPISAGLTSCSTILKIFNKYINKKIEKHNNIESLAKSKLNSIEKKFVIAIKDGQISELEFNNIEEEISNYINMKEKILSLIHI